jgi:urea transport system permease protein
MRRLILLAACLCCCLAGFASAASLEEALAKLASTKFDEIAAGVDGIAASGHPRAAAVLEALGDGRLLVRSAEKRVFLREPTGTLVDAATGTVPSSDVAASALKPVRVNNRVRRALEAALGGLTLTSPDPARRLEAARAVLRARAANALPTLEQALASESRSSSPCPRRPRRTGWPGSRRCAPAGTRRRWRSWPRCPRARPPRCARPRPRRSPGSKPGCA